MMMPSELLTKYCRWHTKYYAKGNEKRWKACNGLIGRLRLMAYPFIQADDNFRCGNDEAIRRLKLLGW